MNTEKKSFLRHFNIYQFKFGSKLFLVMFLLILLSLTITSVIGFLYFKQYIKNSSYERLDQIADSKQKYLEEKFATFQQDFINLTESELSESAIQLKSAFDGFDTYGYEDTLASMETTLKEYYYDEVLSRFSANTPNLEDIFPTSKKQLILQYEFIYNNPHPIGEKDKLLALKKYSDYSDAHKNLHIKVRAFARKYNLSNLYLIDSKSGTAFYNLNKNIALGTNFFNGPYKNSDYATTFQKALASPGTDIIFSDYSNFIPNYNKANGLIAFPIINNEEKVIIVMAELDPAFFQQFLFDSWMYIDKESISLNLIGEDHLLRTNDIDFEKNQEDFLNSLSKKSRRNERFKAVVETKSCALNLGYPQSLQLNKTTQTVGQNYLDKKAFIYSQKLNLGDFNWFLVANAEVFKSYLYLKKVRLAIFFAAILITLFSMYVVILLKNSITRRLSSLSNSIITTAKGEQFESFKSPWQDELGSTIIDFDKLKDRIHAASNFAIELSEGKYTSEFKSESEKDAFANALNTLKEKLKSNKEEAEKRDKEDKIQVWINDGIAKFNDLLRQNNDNINLLSYLIIENLIEYLGANQGGIFLVEGEEEEHKTINLAASYAFDRKKFHTKTIEIGEGLIGNCYHEKKPIHLKNIPQDYIEISSGLGKANPNVLYIVPLMVDEKILGFIELASFEDIDDYKITFINRLADNIAATFSTVKLNTRTAELLEESKRRANEIAQQEEEMRQNMEEMQATQEELARIRDEDEKRSEEQKHELEASYRMIQQLLNSFDGEVLLKDSQGIIVLANEEAANRFNSTPDKMRGKSDADLFSPERAQREFDIDQMVLVDGFYSEEAIELVGSEDVKYFIVKKQFYLPNRQEAGVLTIRNKRQ